MSALVTKQTFPVIEIFGPTIQGEGPDAGRPAYFVRLGGCDYRCTWCDTWYAVDPAQVRAQARRRDIQSISDELSGLDQGPDLVVLTGGNPALHELAPLVAELQRQSFDIAVETQGSVWRDWLAHVDTLVVSPKPPSSGMAGPEQATQFEVFMRRADEHGAQLALKIVVFDEADLLYAEEIASTFPAPLYLSVGTDQGLDEEATKRGVLRRLRWLNEAVARHPALARAHVMPQLHVLAWGTARGV
jgi:7-carboxy-7-deazaguanine synthase